MVISGTSEITNNFETCQTPLTKLITSDNTQLIVT